ncbi:pyridoxal phosphate-dependent enzyme beta subunit [Lactarius sanguifluus]|nr:pyridoxal phosphate-dependent enzyme beta subunit [Lactarius sanguifluus]
MTRSEIVLDSVLDAVGNTPLIRLDRIAKHEGLRCNLLGKLEYTSAGGSVKDRIAKRMIEVAEQEGKLIPGQSVVIEPTSGNTGIGLAMACAIRDIQVIITMPKKMSLEKEAALRALGAEVIRTPNEAAWDAPESHIGVALRLQKEISGGIILDQYRNVNNPLAHELTTAPEIIAAVTSTSSTHAHPSSGKVDVFGIKKAHNKDCIVVGVDPVGSVLALPASLNEVGNGDSYITDDKVSFAAVQLLMRHEGMLVGGSSGSALAGALAWLRSESGCEIAQSPGKNVVVLLPDGLRNYIGKDWFLDMALRQEPSPLARRIAEVLDRPASEDRTNAKIKL